MKRSRLQTYGVLCATSLSLLACGGSSEGGGTPIVLSSDLSLYQWHLGLDNNDTDYHLNVLSAWQHSGSKQGAGVVVGINDTGVEFTHSELALNHSGGSVDFNSFGQTVVAIYDDYDIAHGTAVAGLIAAIRTDNVGVMGVAPAAKYTSISMLNTPTTLSIASALAFDVDVSNNSWGDNEINSTSYSNEGALVLEAIANGVRANRSGLGTVYVFAAGNERKVSANQLGNTNFSELTNSPYTFVIAASTRTGKIATYSTPGASILLAAPSGDQSVPEEGLLTTDLSGELGFNDGSQYQSGRFLDGDYFNEFSGTSASTPLASGVVALMLDVNPALTWRDVRWLLAHAANNDLADDDGSFVSTTFNLAYSHDFGFGILDAEKAVATARQHTNLPEQIICTLTLATDTTWQPDNNSMATLQFVRDSNCAITTIEFVQLNVKVQNLSDVCALQIAFKLHQANPNTNTNAQTLNTSVLSIPQERTRCNPQSSEMFDWTFGSIAYLATSASHDWWLTLENSEAYSFDDESITIDQGSTITLYGH